MKFEQDHLSSSVKIENPLRKKINYAKFANGE